MRDRGDRKAGKLLIGRKALALLRYHEEPQPLPLVAAFTGLLTGFSCALAILVRTRHSIETPQRKESSPFGLTRARSPINRRKQKKWLLSQANM